MKMPEGYVEEVYEYETEVHGMSRRFTNVFRIGKNRFKIEGKFDSYLPQSHAILHIYCPETRQYNKLEALPYSQLGRLYGGGNWNIYAKGYCELRETVRGMLFERAAAYSEL